MAKEMRMEDEEKYSKMKERERKKIWNVECKFYLPIKDPHWLAGTIKRSGICVLPFDVLTSLNWEHHCNGIYIIVDNVVLRMNERKKYCTKFLSCYWYFTFNLFWNQKRKRKLIIGLKFGERNNFFSSIDARDKN